MSTYLRIWIGMLGGLTAGLSFLMASYDHLIIAVILAGIAFLLVARASRDWDRPVDD